MDDDERMSILQPLGMSSSSCGYCAEEKGKRSVAKSSKSYGCWAHALSALAYKELLDRGWRRSGEYLYKPDMGRTCCPQYTIALDANAFRPSRSQRQILQRFNAFIRDGEREGQPGWGPVAANTSEDTSMKPEGEKKKDKGKGKANQAAVEDWAELVRGAEWEKSPEDKPFKHKFEYILEPASYTDEKYELYRRYQMEVHNEPDSKVSSKGFRRFLVDSPLEIESSGSSSHSYGSHHALYRLDGKLIAFAVLDLLPRAVSSVYFVWDPDYAGMSLGKVSALREVQMTREMEREGAWKGEGRYMMGFYIHSCPKMRYKADYQPSFLLDPATNAYYPWSTCKLLLDASSPRIASFSSPSPSSSAAQTVTASSSVSPAEPAPAPSAEDDDDADAAASSSASDDSDSDFPVPPPLGCYEPAKLPKDLLLGAFVIEQRTLVPLLLSSAWHDPDSQQECKELLAATGDAMKGRLAIWPGR